MLSSRTVSPAIVLALPRVELARAFDRKEERCRAAFRRRVERALPARHDVARRERRAVVKCDAAAQMEGVCQAVGGDVPSFGEGRLDLGVLGRSA